MEWFDFSDLVEICDFVGEGGLVVYGATSFSFGDSERILSSKIFPFAGDLADLVGFVGDGENIESEPAVLNLAAKALTVPRGLPRMIELGSSS